MIGILHTTESDPGSGPTVDQQFRTTLSGSAPHMLVDPASGMTWSYLPADTTAKALANKAGGVETNRRPGGVYQVEIVARAADVGGYSDEWYLRLRGVLQQASRVASLEYRFFQDTRRLSFEEWNGPLPAIWYGHCNVPENDHWDPGTLDYARLAPPAAPQPVLTPQEQKTMADVRFHNGGERVPDAEAQAPLEDAVGFAVDSAAQAEKYAKAADTHVQDLRAEVASLKNVVQAVVTLLQSGAGQPPQPVNLDYTLLAGLTADEIGRRLAGIRQN